MRTHTDWKWSYVEDIPRKWKIKENKSTTALSDKIDFKPKTTKRQEKLLYSDKEVSTSSKGYKIVSLCALIIRAPQ